MSVRNLAPNCSKRGLETTNPNCLSVCVWTFILIWKDWLEYQHFYLFIIEAFMITSDLLVVILNNITSSHINKENELMVSEVD